MEQAGEYRIAAPRERVWAALNDPEVLKRCIEGCEELSRTAEDTFHAVVRARVGPVSAAFTGEVKLVNLDPPKGYTLEISAKGGAAGFGRGTANVALAEDGAETVLTYTAEGKVGGKLAQIGQRLIDAAARKTADDFFQAFSHEVAPPAGDVGAAGNDGPSAGPAMMDVRSKAMISVGVLAGVAGAAWLAWRLFSG